MGILLINLSVAQPAEDGTCTVRLTSASLASSPYLADSEPPDHQRSPTDRPSVTIVTSSPDTAAAASGGRYFRSPVGYMSSYMTSRSTDRCGSYERPWTIRTEAGLRVELALYDFSASRSHDVKQLQVFLRHPG